MYFTTIENSLWVYFLQNLLSWIRIRIHFTSWIRIRIRIQKNCWMRIRIKWMRIHSLALILKIFPNYVTYFKRPLRHVHLFRCSPLVPCMWLVRRPASWHAVSWPAAHWADRRAALRLWPSLSSNTTRTGVDHYFSPVQIRPRYFLIKMKRGNVIKFSFKKHSFHEIMMMGHWQWHTYYSS